MPKHELHPQIIKYKGIFDFDLLYKTMRSWLVTRGYYFEESTYKSKPNPLGGREDEITWKCYRKETDYFKFWVIVDFHLWEHKKLEVVKDGKKKQMDKSRLWIMFQSYVESDYQGRWNTPFFTWLRDEIYEKHIIKSEIDNYFTDKLYYYVLKLHNLTKEVLEMGTTSSEYEDVW